MTGANRLLKLGVAMAAGVAPLCALHAQAPAQDSDTIIVLGRGLDLPPGTPAYGSVTLDRETLAEESSGLIENALGDVAGFQQFRRSDSRSANPSAQGVTLRALGGNASSRALVLLDGVPQADPFFGSIPFTTYNAATLGAARITRGGGAGAFGAGAVAGTVELFSADRAQLPLYAASGLYGSRNAQDLSAVVSPDLGAGFASVSGQYLRGDGFFMAPEDQRVAASVPSAYESWSVGLRGVAPIGGNGELQTRVTIARDKRTLRLAGQDSGTEAQDASIRYLSRGPWQVDALAYVQLRNFNNIVISSTRFTPVLDQRNTPATGIGGKIELRPPVGGGHVLRIGADTRYAQANMYEDALNAVSGAVTERRDAAGQQVTTGFYVEDNWTLGALVLTGGARADRWTISNARFTTRAPSGAVTSNTNYADRDGWEGSFRGGVIWHANDAVALRAAGYTSFRLPTLNELYRGFTVFPVVTQANADLSPERLKGGEAGLDLTPLPGAHLSVTGFYNRLDNAIANVTLNADGTLRQRRNVDAIVVKGIEVQADARLGAVDLDVSYAFNDAHVEAGPIVGVANPMDGLRPAQSPRHIVSATLGWNAPAKVRLATTLRYVGPQYEDDLETDLMPSAITLGGYARVPLKAGISLVGRVENLFDEDVVTRQVTSGSGVSTDLGEPRTFWIGLSVRG